MNNLVDSSHRSQMNTILPQYGLLLMNALRNPAGRFGHARALTRILAKVRPRLSHVKSTRAFHLLTLYRRAIVDGKTIASWFQAHIQPITDPSHAQIYFHPYPPVLNDLFHLNPFD